MSSKITKAIIRYYRDNQSYRAIIEWNNGVAQTSEAVQRKPSCFLMRPSSMTLGIHMQQLFARAEREGVKLTKEIW